MSTATKLQEILNFSKKTGDKVIIVNESSDEPSLIILTFDEYRQILDINTSVRDLSEQELLNKINRDISVWRSSQDNNYRDEMGEYSARDLYLPNSPSAVNDFSEKKDFAEDMDTEDDWDWENDEFDNKINDFNMDEFEDVDNLKNDLDSQDSDFNIPSQFEEKSNIRSFKPEEPKYISTDNAINSYPPFIKEELPVINEADEFREEPDIPVGV